MGLSLKISIMIMFVLLFSLVLNAFLNFYNFKNTYTKLVSTTYSVVIENMKEALEYQLNLGLNTDNSVESIKTSFIEQKQSDENIDFIQVINNKGKIIFSTSAENINTNVSSSWKEKILRKTTVSKENNIKKTVSSKNVIVRLPETKKAIVIGLPFINNFGVKQGAVILGYSKEYLEDSVDGMILVLSQGGISIFIIFTIITTVGVYLYLRNVIKDFKFMASTLEGHSTKLPHLSSKKPDSLKDFLAFNKIRKELIKDIDSIDSKFKYGKVENLNGN